MNPSDTSPADPPHWWQGLTPYMWRVLFITFLGWTFDVMDALIFNFIKVPACKELLGPAPTDPALLAAWNGSVTEWAGGIQAALLGQ